jgi:predicted MPP superfamily phosphohydrolase
MPVIAHLSDTHLDGTQPRLQRLLDVVAETVSAGADALVVTGDLTDHGTAAEYEQFACAMPADRRWLAAVGNHEGLAELARHPRLAAILTGHMHTSLAARFAGALLLGAGGVASTMRLGSRTDPIVDAAAAPAFAVHVFDDTGWVRTVFHSLTPAS